MSCLQTWTISTGTLNPGLERRLFLNLRLNYACTKMSGELFAIMPVLTKRDRLSAIACVKFFRTNHDRAHCKSASRTLSTWYTTEFVTEIINLNNFTQSSLNSATIKNIFIKLNRRLKMSAYLQYKVILFILIAHLSEKQDI